MVSSLAKNSSREDFVVCTHPIVDGIKTLLAKLLDAEMEGDSRENSGVFETRFSMGVGTRYKEAASRDLAASVLRFLADAEEVEPRDANRFFDQMYAGGLCPVGLPLFEIEEEDLEDDGDEETKTVD